MEKFPSVKGVHITAIGHSASSRGVNDFTGSSHFDMTCLSKHGRIGNNRPYSEVKMLKLFKSVRYGGVNSGNNIIHKEVLEQKTHRVKKNHE
jgi:hypothetical protein